MCQDRLGTNIGKELRGKGRRFLHLSAERHRIHRGRRTPRGTGTCSQVRPSVCSSSTTQTINVGCQLTYTAHTRAVLPTPTHARTRARAVCVHIPEEPVLLRKNGLFLSFPYVCPEPVLVKIYKWHLKKTVFTHLHPAVERPPCPHAQRRRDLVCCRSAPFSEFSLCLSRACLGKNDASLV